MRAALGGSERAAAELFDTFWTLAWRAAHAATGRPDLADEAAQEAFVKAIRALATFDTERPFGPWIARIAINSARDLVRREDRHDRVALEVAHRPATGDGSSLPRGTEVVDSINALSPERREVVVLHHVLGFQIDEIAEIVGAPSGTVASRLGRGVSQLREALEAYRHA